MGESMGGGGGYSTLRGGGFGGIGKKPFWSKGTGCVEFATAREAQNAINSLQGSELDGRALTLDKWTGGGTDRANKGNASAKVHVANLSFKTRTWKLKEHFEPFGKIVRCDVMTGGK